MATDSPTSPCPRCGGATEVNPGEFVPLCFCHVAPDPLDQPIYSYRQASWFRRESLQMGMALGVGLGFLIVFVIQLLTY